MSAGLHSLLERVLVHGEDMHPHTAAAFAEELARVAAGRSTPAVIAEALHAPYSR
ncbi:MAG: hypothetical protein H0T79_20095 [Deltaproteobacteria bacterium]|nr:hypothetical protein [Deltaproteobacteria bacterium]